MRRTEFEPMSTTATGLRSLLWSMTSRLVRASVRLDQARKARRHVLGKRGAAAGQAWIGHEIVLSAERLLVLAGMEAFRASIGPHPAALQIVLEVRHHDLVENLLVHRWVENWHHGLDATVEVARHHVCRADIDDSLSIRKAVPSAEAINARMLEGAADDALDMDGLRQIGN